MRILPAVQQPRPRINRTHRPEGLGGYSRFRPCLRWDFGFLCAFCQLHEADFSPEGIEGQGTTTIEHYVLQSHEPSLRNEYANCYYACRLCNSARSTRPAEMGGAKLQTPDTQAWSEHFKLEDDKLVPVEGNIDAAYTADVYDINDARKVLRREQRRLNITEALEVLTTARERWSQLAKRIESESDPEKLLGLAELARDFRRIYHFAQRQLRRYLPVPWDAPMRCACSNSEASGLSDDLIADLLEVPVADSLNLD